MEPGYINVDVFEQFPAALEQFKLLAYELLSKRMKNAQHGDVEAMMQKHGTEVYRVMLQEYFNIREAEEPRLEQVIGADGIVRNHCRKGTKRDLMTVFGEVQVKRLGYSARGTTSLFPLDRELNLPKDKYSHGLRRRDVEEVAQNSFDEAVAAIRRTTGGKLPKLQAENLAAVVAQDFETFYTNRELNEPEKTVDPLVLTFDGKGVVMKKEALRDATKKAADREKHKMSTRLSRGEKRNRKRMAQVAAVYSIKRHVRSAETIMNLNEHTKNVVKPKAQNKRVWASVARESYTVTDEAFQEAVRRDPEKSRPWPILIDGHEQQLKNIESCIEKYQLSNTVIILDFIHVLEYLWKAAYCFEKEGSQQAENWVGKRALKILKGKASDVAAGIRRSATLRKLSDKARKPANLCADYLLKYQNMLKYDEYLAQGYPIATGVIEGACRHLIKDRMDVTGARWGLAGAEAVLKLRSLKSSGDLDSYWDYHKAQEFQRNHSQLPSRAAA